MEYNTTRDGVRAMMQSATENELVGVSTTATVRDVLRVRNYVSGWRGAFPGWRFRVSDNAAMGSVAITAHRDAAGGLLAADALALPFTRVEFDTAAHDVVAAVENSRALRDAGPALRFVLPVGDKSARAYALPVPFEELLDALCQPRVWSRAQDLGGMLTSLILRHAKPSNEELV